MRFQPGQLVAGRYHVIRPIATGGGAEIYQVHDNLRLTTVALKLLRSELTRDPDFINRFKEEAEALSKLNHPNIVRFYEYVQLENLVFIVMDFIDGSNLRKKINNQPGMIPLQETIEIFRSVCSGLHYAHQQGIVHCDIKPENILIDATGKVLLSDFGIASFTGMRELAPGGIGTPSYMAPEQILNKTVIPQTDIYALGIMLYEMVTGFKPFTGTSINNNLPLTERIKWEQVNGIPASPDGILSTISRELNAVIICCLEKDPGNRFTDIEQFMDSLERSASPNLIQKTSVTEDISQTRKAQLQPLSNKKTAIPIMLILAAIAITMVIVIAGNSGPSSGNTSEAELRPPQTVAYPNACMEIVITMSPMRTLTECVQSISITPDNTLQVTIEWKARIGDPDDYITVSADTNNHNMYLLDDLGNRLDHIATGGGANQDMNLFNGNTKLGWFIFPAPDPAASHFYFVDDDNGVRSPILDRTW